MSKRPEWIGTYFARRMHDMAEGNPESLATHFAPYGRSVVEVPIVDMQRIVPLVETLATVVGSTEPRSRGHIALVIEGFGLVPAERLVCEFQRLLFDDASAVVFKFRPLQ